MDLLVASEESLQRAINPTIYSKVDFVKKLNEGSSFITRVMEQPKILIKGVINDLRKPGKD
jgi:hypothetical protein